MKCKTDKRNPMVAIGRHHFLQEIVQTEHRSFSDSLDSTVPTLPGTMGVKINVNRTYHTFLGFFHISRVILTRTLLFESTNILQLQGRNERGRRARYDHPLIT